MPALIELIEAQDGTITALASICRMNPAQSYAFAKRIAAVQDAMEKLEAVCPTGIKKPNV